MGKGGGVASQLDGSGLLVAPMDPDDVARNIDALANLRMRVFSEYPYLYDGDLSYERDYLRPYVDGRDALVVGAWDGGELVGASTGTPMEDHSGELGEAFAKSGIDLGRVFYCGESVLLPQYRGRGVGHRFFDLREERARCLDRDHVAFCSVIRPQDHPARPEDYRSLEPFWTRRGYAKMPGVEARFAWKDHGDDMESEKPLQFWIRRLEEHP